eukprot:1680209-Rhodomonas_salina.1
MQFLQALATAQSVPKCAAEQQLPPGKYQCGNRKIAVSLLASVTMQCPTEAYSCTVTTEGQFEPGAQRVHFSNCKHVLCSSVVC